MSAMHDDSRAGRIVLGRWMGLLALAATGAPGCTDSPRTLRIVIDSNLNVPAELDEIRVTATGSRTPEGNICEPVSRRFQLTSAGDLPLRVSIEIGPDYTEWAAVRIVGLRGGTNVFVRESRVPWPSEGIRDLETRLDRDCFAHPCGANEQCVMGECAAVPFPGLFDDLSYVDRGVPCDRSAPIGDGGATGDGGE
jgi:hypothetical protein